MSSGGTAAIRENNQRWVTLLVNHEPMLDGHEFELPTTIHTDASIGQAVINSAYLHPGDVLGVRADHRWRQRAR
jgi:hypothetical protein